MTPVQLNRELAAISAMLNRWQAEAFACFYAALALGLLWVGALSDLFFKYGRAGRAACAATVMAAAAVGVFFVARSILRRRSAPAVAARLERAFPELDNHLINYVLFSARARPEPIEQAYLQRGLPEWHKVRTDALRNRRVQWKSYAAVLAALLLIGGARALVGPAWFNALMRVANPFSHRAPVTIARIVSVLPGNASVVQGSNVVIVCKASGRKGYPVSLDLWPGDDQHAIHRLGAMTGEGQEEFSFTVPNVTAAFKYRLTVGDAVSERFTVNAVVPLSIEALSVTISPPEYTRLAEKTFNALEETMPAPAGSKVAFSLRCNREIASARAAPAGMEPIALRADGNSWSGSMVITGQTHVVFSACDARGETASAPLKLDLLPDKPPVIRILSPAGRVVLADGAAPQVQLEVTDDFGLAEIRVEQLVTEGKSAEDAAPARTVGSWAATGGVFFATNWAGAVLERKQGLPLVFRVAATDFRGEKVQGARALSPPIVFDSAAAQEIQEKTKQTSERAEKSLESLLEMQQLNLKETISLSEAVAVVQGAQWKPVIERQKSVRALAGQLLADPQKPLGALTETVRSLHQGAMNEAIDALARIPAADAGAKAPLAQRAVMLENRILRGLSRVEAGIETVRQHRQVTGLLSTLDAIVKNQEVAFETTKGLFDAPSKITDTLVQSQDRLSSELTAFLQTCRKESETLTASDKEFSAILMQIAETCESKKVSADMLRAAEHLQKKNPKGAAPIQDAALAVLKDCQKLMNAWRQQDAEETASQLRDALSEASEKMEKMAKLEAKLADAVRETSRQQDKSGKKTEGLEEEMEEVQNQIEDALLSVATDLQIFPQLPVGNDLVEDLFQVYEEVKQEKGSAKTEAKETGLQKEDWIVEVTKAMEKTKKRMDDVETWLENKPDSAKRLTENFDQQEMPKIPVIPMASEMEDIISDLLEQEEKISKESDDSATNQGVPDTLMGWAIAEGEFVDYSAKGKSGNVAPDHKEQDGRANIGREGMSDGEATAASGKINEGDKNIEKRMTQESSQSGQIQEEGHSQAKATGGGKQSGYADELGMAGSGPKRQATTKQGSELGLQAMLRRNAQALYARAELAHVRSGALDEAVRQMSLAEEGLEKGYPIGQVREHQRRAVAALKKTKTQLNAPVAGQIEDAGPAADANDDQLAMARDEAPAEYRQLVADYFKSLSAAK